jgi:hypothetical protein
VIRNKFARRFDKFGVKRGDARTLTTSLGDSAALQ